MSKGVIFRIFNRFPSLFCSLALFGFFTLAGLNQQLNLNLPSEAKVRDKVDFSTAFATAEKLDIRSASNGTAAVPSTSYVASYGSWRSAYSGTASAVSSGADFAIYSRPTTSNDFIDENESGVLAYKGSFFFGHSGGPLNWVKSAAKDNTVSIDGTVYRIVQKTTLPIATVKNVYFSISEYHSYRGKNYDAVIMTCGDGTYGANGNSSDWRTFLFLKRA